MTKRNKIIFSFYIPIIGLFKLHDAKEKDGLEAKIHPLGPLSIFYQITILTGIAFGAVYFLKSYCQVN